MVVEALEKPCAICGTETAPHVYVGRDCIVFPRDEHGMCKEVRIRRCAGCETIRHFEDDEEWMNAKRGKTIKRRRVSARRRQRKITQQGLSTVECGECEWDVEEPSHEAALLGVIHTMETGHEVTQ